MTCWLNVERVCLDTLLLSKRLFLTESSLESFVKRFLVECLRIVLESSLPWKKYFYITVEKTLNCIAILNIQWHCLSTLGKGNCFRLRNIVTIVATKIHSPASVGVKHIRVFRPLSSDSQPSEGNRLSQWHVSTTQIAEQKMSISFRRKVVGKNKKKRSLGDQMNSTIFFFLVDDKFYRR